MLNVNYVTLKKIIIKIIEIIIVLVFINKNICSDKLNYVKLEIFLTLNDLDFISNMTDGLIFYCIFIPLI